jgi:hypothetical protein
MQSGTYWNSYEYWCMKIPRYLFYLSDTLSFVYASRYSGRPPQTYDYGSQYRVNYPRSISNVKLVLHFNAVVTQLTRAILTLHLTLPTVGEGGSENDY